MYLLSTTTTTDKRGRWRMHVLIIPQRETTTASTVRGLKYKQIITITKFFKIIILISTKSIRDCVNQSISSRLPISESGVYLINIIKYIKIE